VGLQTLRWLNKQDDEIVGMVVHPEGNQIHVREMIAESGLPRANIFAGDDLQNPATLAAISGLSPDIGLSVYFGYIVKKEFLDIFPMGCLNLHPSFLPYNRGAYPNVWAIVDGTPAGATLHYIDEGVDTGDIIAQSAVEIEPTDTGQSLYKKLEVIACSVLRDGWKLIQTDNFSRKGQSIDAGTQHRLRDAERIDVINLEATYKAQELIDILRARTFPPHPGAYFEKDGRRVYMNLELAYEDKLKGNEHD